MDLVTFLNGVEASPLGMTVRESAWIYPLCNILHVLGAALLVGAVATFDIAALRGGVRAGAVLRAGIPVAATGLSLALMTGLVLFIADASALARNPAFLAKLAMIALGLANVVMFHLIFGRDLALGRPLRGIRAAATLSLIAWVGVLLAGRAIAYV